MNADLLHELNTSAFSGLVPGPCEHCGMDECEKGFALSSNGFADRPESPRAVVFWDRCPGNYFFARSYGIIKLPLYQLVCWLIEKGEHRKRGISFGAELLYNECFRIRSGNLPEKLHEAKAHEEARRQRAMKR